MVRVALLTCPPRPNIKGMLMDDKIRTPRWPDFHHTGPGTLAGRYLRAFWHPVFHSAELATGKGKPIKIMNVDYALYRGEEGRPHLLDARCQHRGMKLAPGWI